MVCRPPPGWAGAPTFPPTFPTPASELGPAGGRGAIDAAAPPFHISITSFLLPVVSVLVGQVHRPETKSGPRTPFLLDGRIGALAQLSQRVTRSASTARVDALGAPGAGAGSGRGCGGGGGLGWLAEELDQGEGNQQQPGQHQDGLAGGLAPEHQGERGQGDGGDAQDLLVGIDPGPHRAGAEPGVLAPPRSRPIPAVRRWRVRTAITDWPVRNAPPATTRARTRIVRSPRRR